MGFWKAKTWKDWASEWGLTYHPTRFLSSTPEWMAGSYRGYLVKLGWLGDRHLEFRAIIRYPKVPEAGVIRQQLLDAPSLAELPGWTKLKPARAPRLGSLSLAAPAGGPTLVNRTVAGEERLEVSDSSLVWTVPFALRRPDASKLQGWLEQLTGVLAQTCRAFQSRCETCGRSVGQRFVMVDGLPTYLCESCQQDLAQKGRMAEQAYDEGEANRLLGTFYGMWASLVGGVLWGLISFSTRRMFALVAIGIGMLVGMAYRYGAKKMDLAGRAIGVVLTLGGVVLGDVLFYALALTRLEPQPGFHLEAGWTMFWQMLAKGSGSVIVSLLFGVVGSLYTVRVLARPKLASRIEPAEETKSKAA